MPGSRDAWDVLAAQLEMRLDVLQTQSWKQNGWKVKNNNVWMSRWDCSVTHSMFALRRLGYEYSYFVLQESAIYNFWLHFSLPLLRRESLQGVDRIECGFTCARNALPLNHYTIIPLCLESRRWATVSPLRQASSLFNDSSLNCRPLARNFRSVNAKSSVWWN